MPTWLLAAMPVIFMPQWAWHLETLNLLVNRQCGCREYGRTSMAQTALGP